tara:strand:+ start:266 stop:367 length:102 start_codon:yes stop_codon:yes gene_type:complete
MSKAVIKTMWACNARIEKLEERIAELIVELRNK